MTDKSLTTLDDYRPKFLWVGGLPGSGCLAVRSLLDAHPDVLAFPFDLIHFLQFVNARVYDLPNRSWQSAVTLVMPLILADHTFVQYGRMKPEDVGFDIEHFTADVLACTWRKEGVPRQFDLETLLYALYYATCAQWPAYGVRHAKYFCVITCSTHFPWDEARLRDGGMHLIPHRDWTTFYNRHRNYDLSHHGDSLGRFLRWKAVRYVTLLRSASEGLRQYGDGVNFHHFNFEELRTDCATRMREIAAWLEIPYEDKLTELTIFGRSEDGCTTEGVKTGARVAVRPGRYFFPPTEFETRLQGLARPYNGPREPCVVFPPFGLIEACRLAMSSAQNVSPAELGGWREKFITPSHLEEVPQEKFAAFAGRTFSVRGDLVRALQSSNVTESEGAAILRASCQTSSALTGLRRCWLALIMLWVYVSCRMMRKAYGYGWILRLLMHLRLYFFFRNLALRARKRQSS